MLIIAIIALGSVVIGIAPEIMGDFAEDNVKPYLGDNYKLILFVVFVLLVTVSVVFSLKDFLLKLFSIKTDAPTKQDLAKNQFVEIRKGLTASYQNRLNQKLANRYPINLELTYSLKGTDTKASLYDNSKFTVSVIRIKGKIQQIFDRHRGRLLIIGAAGSGKTTLLLKLALSLLEREQNTIPIVVNIATWRKRFESVEDWFTELLPQMGFSKGLTKQLLEQKAILPLFDGLDELAIEQRKPCLEAIAKYGSTNGVKYIICSRIIEYSETIDAPVYCQLQVKPLTLDQIKTQLKQAGTPEANGMLDAISQDKLLAEVIKVPFYLNTVQLLFSSMKVISEFGFTATAVEGRQAEIVETFAASSLNGLQDYKADNAKRWLSFLASRMNQKGLVVFELIDLQYDWWEWTETELYLPYLLNSIVVGIMFVLYIGLKYGILFGALVGAFFKETFLGLIIGSIAINVIIIIAVLYKAFNDTPIIIHTRLIKNQNFISFVRNNSYELVNPFVSKTIISIWLLACCAYSIIYNIRLGVMISLIGLMLLFIIRSLTAWFNKISKYDYIKVETPYQKFCASLKVLHLSFILHFYLRWQLARRQLLPYKLVTFLKQLTLNNMLESDGGTWRFRHRILQDYYADMWEREYKGEYEPKG